MRVTRRLVLPVLMIAATMAAAHPAPAMARVRAPLALTRKADFNGDGFADVAIGVPFEDISSTVDAGAVNVIYGASGGLTSTNNQIFYEGNGGVPGTAQTGDAYGYALVSGDFNGDGYADLAVGVPGKNVGGKDNTGIVNVLYGSASGLTSSGSQVWQQGAGGLADTAEASDQMGYTLASGDLNGDGYADLAIAAVGESLGSVASAGAVSVLYGSAQRLTATGNQFWTENSTGLDPAESGDRFGISLAIGDFNHDGFGDLAAGIAYEDLGTATDAGAVEVLAGSSGGLTATGAQLWTQDSPGILDAVEGGDGFGYALAAGDLNGDGYSDLAVGVPGESLGTISLAGAMNVIYGSAAGLSSTGNQFFDQDSPSVPGTSEFEDEFGTTVAVGDFNGDGKGDVAVGVPYEDIGSTGNAGAVNVLYGSSTGLTTTGSQLWYQGNDGITGASEQGDFFGSAMSAQNFGKGSQADLVVGAPGENVGSIVDAGDIQAIYGGSAGLSATGNQEWDQNTSGIQGTSEQGDSFGWGVAGGPGPSTLSPIRLYP